MYIRRFTSVLILSVLLALPMSAFAQAPANTDTTAPSDVLKLSGTPGNGEVLLKWDSATDNEAVKGYKIYSGVNSVTVENTARYSQMVDAGDVLEFPVSGLKNGKTYYFAVTAYDASGNESESYSPEVSATPDTNLVAASALSQFNKTSTSVAGDTKDLTASQIAASAPTIVNAKAMDKDTVSVVFSQAVKLPETSPAASFVIQDNLTLENLTVSSAALDTKDQTGKTVILKTDNQIPGTEYVLTVTDVASDKGDLILAGNGDSKIFSGVSGPVVDSGAVGGDGKGDSKTQPTMNAAPEGFRVAQVESLSDTTVSLTFSKEVVLSLDPKEHFKIHLKGDEEGPLEITGVDVNDQGTVVTLTTATQGPVAYTLEMKDVADIDGKILSGDDAKVDFNGAGGAATADTTPPEDVTKLAAKALKDLRVRLSWKGSVNNAGDLMQYILYLSSDSGKNYGKIVALGKDALQFESGSLTPGDYFFKVAAQDASGNESSGAVTKIRLVETGPGIGLLGLTSVGLGRVFGRRKKASRKA